MPKPRVICLVSGGIDSPVAATLLSKKYEIIPLHFCLYPFYCKGSFEAMIWILRQLQTKIKFKELLIFPWAGVLSAIIKCKTVLCRRYRCVLCRRAMFRAAELVAQERGAIAIATGEALAQKASQTLPNLAATSAGISLSIFKPLLGLDKSEIEEISRTLGIWSEAHVGCCTAVPRKPVTAAKADILLELYADLSLDKIVQGSLEKMLELRKLDKPPSAYLRAFLKRFK